jgi:hypothetical protein
MRTFPFGEHHWNRVVAARSEMFRAQQEFKTRRLDTDSDIIRTEWMMSRVNNKDRNVNFFSSTNQTKEVLRNVGVPTKCSNKRSEVARQT